MSVVYLGVGQCGTQILASFLSSNLKNNRKFILDEIDQFRGILIDSEPKSYARIIQNPNISIHLRPNNIILGHCGRGSNWAYGYHDGGYNDHNDNLIEESLNSIRKEIERINICPGICLVHSLAGGTGSGLGLRLFEEAKHQFNTKLQLTFSVAPYQYGESPLQAYNSLLCLSGLTRIADGIVLLNNDWFLSQLQSQYSNNPQFKKIITNKNISFEEINQLITEQMINILSPCTSLSINDEVLNRDNRRIKCFMEPWELCRTLTPLPDTKFIRCISINDQDHHLTNNLNWLYLLKELQFKLNQCPIDVKWRFNKTHKQSNCTLMNTIGSLLIYRTKNKRDLQEAQSILSDLNNDNSNQSFNSMQSPSSSSTTTTTKLSKSSLAGRQLIDFIKPVNWNPKPIDQWFDVDLNNTNRSLTLAFNSCCITEDLKSLVYRAKLRCNAGAYLHWYERFGCTKDDFDDAFEQLNHIIQCYKNFM